jgi:hypothetical protein
LTRAFHVDAALVGCGHVSGLLMRHGWPLARTLPVIVTDHKSGTFSARGGLTTGSGALDPPVHDLNHTPAPVDCRTAGFRPSSCLLWVNCAGLKQAAASRDVRFAPKADKKQIISVCPLSASGLSAP